jgi:DNA repair protein RecN (Recombination protein N)
MIKSLRIRNLATIEDLELDLDRGFTILTGETGAGKSIIIDSIRLVMGGKGSTDLVRTGSRETSVESIFDLPAEEMNPDREWKDSEDELLFQRRISSRGTGKGYINGTLVPVKKMRDISWNLIDIFGQNDHIFLQRASNQLSYLDHFSSTVDMRKEVAELARKLKQLQQEMEQLSSRKREREQRRDYLDYQIKEINKAELHPNEEEELRRERDVLKNSEIIKMNLDESLTLAYQGDRSISSLLSGLQKNIGRMAQYIPELNALEKDIDQCAIFIRELADILMKYQEKQAASPQKLEQVEERLSLIENLKRKYGDSISEILDYLKRARREYEELSVSEEKISQLETEIEEYSRLYQDKARSLHQRRAGGARKLEKQMEREIQFLGMDKARVKIKVDAPLLEKNHADLVRETGLDEVEFLISPNPGETLKPLKKIASGGELSRLMLAVKSIGRDHDHSKTLIFDEIDAGIGGHTAEFVARKLQQLAQNNQVLCITHLPQIASFALHHFRIEKNIIKDRTFTTVKKLTRTERIQEIARLLAGSHISDATLQNAKEMLERNQAPQEK